jgi:hypothetical protein
MSTAPAEPRNPLYLLLLLAGLVFVVTALAYTLILVLEQKGDDPGPQSEFRDALSHDGWRWLLYEVAVMIVLGVASMVLDHLRDRRKRAATPPPPPPEQPFDGHRPGG